MDFTGSRILPAEDNELNHESVLGLLCGAGMKQEIVFNGREDPKCFEEGCPRYYSLVFMDIQMPVP